MSILRNERIDGPKKSKEEIAVIKATQLRHLGKAVWTLDAFTDTFTFLWSSLQRLNLFVASDF